MSNFRPEAIQKGGEFYTPASLVRLIVLGARTPRWIGGTRERDNRRRFALASRALARSSARCSSRSAVMPIRNQILQ